MSRHLRFSTLATLAALVCAPVLLGGCSGWNVERAIYEGARARDESLRGTPQEQSKTPLPPYEQYERERRALAAPASN
jgi:hypothetical protein